MAFSCIEGKGFFKDWLSTFAASTANLDRVIFKVLDVGPGFGEYAMHIRDLIPDMHITGVEVFEPYVERFALKDKYDDLIVSDIEDYFDSSSDVFDLIIFGDVLEHFSNQRALRIFNKAKYRSKFVFVSVPLMCPEKDWHAGYNQLEHEWQENIHEKHLLDLTVFEFKNNFGPFVCMAMFRVTTVFIAEGRLL